MVVVNKTIGWMNLSILIYSLKLKIWDLYLWIRPCALFIIILFKKLLFVKFIRIMYTFFLVNICVIQLVKDTSYLLSCQAHPSFFSFSVSDYEEIQVLGFFIEVVRIRGACEFWNKIRLLVFSILCIRGFGFLLSLIQ